MAIKEPTGWGAECDDCFREYDGELWECEDEDSVISALEADGWVYDEENDEWLCPDCAEKRKNGEDDGEEEEL